MANSNECCPTDGIKKKMSRTLKEINTAQDLMLATWWTSLGCFLKLIICLVSEHRFSDTNVYERLSFRKCHNEFYWRKVTLSIKPQPKNWKSLLYNLKNSNRLLTVKTVFTVSIISVFNICNICICLLSMLNSLLIFLIWTGKSFDILLKY